MAWDRYFLRGRKEFVMMLCWLGSVWILLITTKHLECKSIDAGSEGFFVWQGFEATWLRRFAHGVETPHRLGSFTNLISCKDFGGVANVSFTPGQDGDYAYPQVRWRFGVLNDDSSVSVKSDILSLKWSDSCHIDSYGNPVANSTFSKTVSWKLWNGEQSNYEATMSGFEMFVSCNPAHQPPGHECTKSNSIWPYEYSLMITDCVKDELDFTCNVDIRIIRGDSPHPGGKKLEFSFDYVLNVHILLFSGPDQSFKSSYNPIGIQRKNYIRDPTMNGSLSIPHDPSLPNTVVGLRGFSFTMIETDGRTKLGRYMESLIFHVEDDPSTIISSKKDRLGSEDSEVSIIYNIGVGAGETVYDSKIQYGLYPVLLQFGKNDVTLEEKIGMYSSCPVCFSADVFDCKLHHLNETCTCSVDVL